MDAAGYPDHVDHGKRKRRAQLIFVNVAVRVLQILSHCSFAGSGDRELRNPGTMVMLGTGKFLQERAAQDSLLIIDEIRAICRINTSHLPSQPPITTNTWILRISDIYYRRRE